MVLPQLTPDAGAEPAVGAPPPRFKPIRGKITYVRLSHGPPFKSLGYTVAQTNGLRFEQKVQVFLKNMLGASYRVQPFLHFDDQDEHGTTRPRSCIPDGLYVDDHGHATIVEIKSQHMPEAWWQLRKLYEPVVQALPFVNSTSVLEIVKSFDPAMGFPEPVLVFQSWREAVTSDVSKFKVLTWRR